MKIFRINKVEEFFGTFPKAISILNQAEDEFEKRFEGTIKKIHVPPQKDFAGKSIHIMFELKSIVFVDDHELYVYDFVEVDMLGN
jgi:hypothetical protein